MDYSKRLSLIKNHLSSDIEVVICAAKRSPFTKSHKGGLKDTPMEEVLAQLYSNIIESSKLDPSKIEEIIIGNVIKAGSSGMTLRMAQLMAGIPVSVPCYAINRMCSSGLQAVSTLANSIKSGEISIGLAGGAESMTFFDMNNSVQPPLPERAFKIKDASNCVLPVGVTSDNVIKKFKLSRDQLDSISEESHAKAVKAQKSGFFDEEIVPIKTFVSENGAKKEVVVTKDDGVRENTNKKSLAKLRPAFGNDGGTTAGNSSQVSDGAAVVLLASRKAAEENGLPILAKWYGFYTIGVSPDILGIGPAVAIPKVIRKYGLSLSDIDVFEVNEAFASIVAYTLNELGIDPSKVNPNGGAIAIGHPLAATGARQLATIMSELRRIKGKYGVISMCIGSGMGGAAVIENLIR